MKNIKLLPLLLLLCVTAFQSCVKNEFDEPPAQPPSSLVATTTLAELKASILDQFETIETDVIIEGVVVSSDAAGNIYKELYIQDGTGGAVLALDVNELNAFFEVGQTIFVKLNGLVVEDDDGMLSIGSGIIQSGNFPQLARMPQEIAEEVIEKGVKQETVEPTVITLEQINDDLTGTLIQLTDVQFTNGFAGVPYATEGLSVNTFIENCSGSSIIVRNSGFSSFYTELTPLGKGTLTAVLSKFAGDYQLFIRDQNDVNMEGPRCGDTGTGNTDIEANTTISELSDLHTIGSFENITDDLVIEGTVTSSDQSGNFFKKIFLEDETGGVQIIANKFDLYFDYPVGSTVYVKMNGLTLGDDNGALAIGGGVEDNNGSDRLARIEEFQVGQYLVRGTSGNANPTTLTIDEVSDEYLNRLVRFNDVQFTDNDAGETYADAENLFSLNRTIEDCENTIVLRSSGYADFASTNTATGRGSITAILTVFQGTYQLAIRDLSDVDMTGERCDGSNGGGGGNPPTGDAELEEGFNTTVQYDPINLDGWYNIAVEGSDEERWIGNEFNGNKYADASAYNSVDPELDLWLITPGIELDETKTIQFKSNQHHWVDGNGAFSVWISNDFDGSNVQAANWEQINCNLPSGSNDWYEWVDSGVITLNDYFSNGEVFVAFQYVGEEADDVTGFQLDDVIVKGQ